MNDQPNAASKTTSLTLLVNRLVRTYLWAKAEQRANVKLDHCKDSNGDIDWARVPNEFNEKKKDFAQTLFLEFRSRREQAFVSHFSQTFFAVTQRLKEPEAVFLGETLLDPVQRDDLKTLTLLALSANS